VGKHSASDGQDDREGRSAGACPGPVLPPPPPTGNGRRRRGDDDFADTGGFAAVRPQDLDGPPPAHPEHREHAAWGAAGGWAEPGRGHGGTRELSSHPMDAWSEDWVPVGAPMGAPAGTRPAAGAGTPRHTQTAARLLPRPRQDFVAAFDVPPAPAPPGGSGSGTAPLPEHGPEPEPEPGSGGKGRTLSGIAAAAVVTVLAVVATGQVTGGDKKHSGSDATSTSTRSSDDGASRSKVRDAPRSTAAAATYDLLMARTYPLDPGLQLSGSFTTVPGHQRAPGHGTVTRFRVDVEKGLPLDAAVFTESVFRTLNDGRGWGHGGAMTFERVSTGPADIIISLASPGTTAKWCAKSGLDTSVENVSCDAASTPRTMINAYRWAQGATTYGPGRIHEYRQMLINHEVGHRLGHGHVACASEGGLAPVMMQQTKFLSLDGGPTCRPNPWPFPPAAAAAPSAP
jgi:hypothetical protein